MTKALSNTGLSDSDLKIIQDTVASIAEIDQVILFGSRAKATYKLGSDVDLVIKSKDMNDHSANLVAELLNEQSPLPYFFDVLTYSCIHEPKLLEHIDRVGILLFDRIDKAHSSTG